MRPYVQLRGRHGLGSSLIDHWTPAASPHLIFADPWFKECVQTQLLNKKVFEITLAKEYIYILAALEIHAPEN